LYAGSSPLPGFPSPSRQSLVDGFEPYVGDGRPVVTRMDEEGMPTGLKFTVRVEDTVRRKQLWAQSLAEKDVDGFRLRLVAESQTPGA